MNFLYEGIAVQVAMVGRFEFRSRRFQLASPRGNGLGSDTSVSAASFSVKSYFPFAFSQASIATISFSCAVTMSCASFLTSTSLPLARTTSAMSTAA